MEDNNTMKLSHPGKKLTGRDRYRKLYHYTSFDTFLKIFYGKRLKFGEAVSMNDIMEANKRLMANLNHYPLLFALRDTLAKYKQLCFTMNYDSLLKGCMSNSMWYHYGDKRNGVCLEFDFNRLDLPTNAIYGPVSYKYLLKAGIILPDEVQTINNVEKYVRDNLKKIFFEKTIEWKCENEFRIMCPNESFLNINGAISAIYFTDCESEHVKVAEKIVGNDFPIRYIDYMTECDEITPIDNGTISMRTKIENIRKNHENDKTFMQQALEFYEANKHDKNRSLVMTGL
ncbi:MAG: DUF2971 domain-containing protein [Bacteroidales bacterium]|nr:DUF2971 domain-containing protein [Bacteroidales bacterium]